MIARGLARLGRSVGSGLLGGLVAVWMVALLAPGPFGGGPVSGPFGSAPASTSTAGIVKLGVDVPALVVLASDQTESAGTYKDVTGWAFTPAASSTYLMECFVIHSTAATTTGIFLQFVAPTGTDFAGSYGLTGSSTGETTQTQRLGPATSGVQGSGSGTTASQPSWTWALVQTTGSPTGDLKVQFRTEVATSAVTIQAGSFCRYIKVQ